MDQGGRCADDGGREFFCQGKDTLAGFLDGLDSLPSHTLSGGACRQAWDGWPRWSSGPSRWSQHGFAPETGAELKFVAGALSGSAALFGFGTFSCLLTGGFAGGVLCGPLASAAPSLV